MAKHSEQSNEAERNKHNMNQADFTATCRYTNTHYSHYSNICENTLARWPEKLDTKHKVASDYNLAAIFELTFSVNPQWHEKGIWTFLSGVDQLHFAPRELDGARTIQLVVNTTRVSCSREAYINKVSAL